MKKNYFLICWSIFIISLIFKKLGWAGGGVLISLSSIFLIIGYINRLIKPKDNPIGLKLTIIELYTCLIFTLIGLLFRHQFWYLPFWRELFKYIWPVLSLIVIVQSIIIGKAHFKVLTEEYKNTLFKEILIPLVVVFTLAIPTFFLPTHNFVRVFKPYSYELINRWNNENR